MDSIKNRKSNASKEQKQLMLEFIKKHPQLQSGKFSNEFTQKDSQILWQEIEVHLNSCGGGANKDWKSWRKTWHDLRSRTKSKQVQFTKHQRGTGGGPALQNPINDDIEREVLETIEPVLIKGHTNIAESSSDFTFEADLNFDSHEKPVEPECEISTENNNAQRKKKFPRATRKKLTYTSEAAENYKVSLDRKNEIKSKYYEEKIHILKRIAAAKEKSAASKEKLAAAQEKTASTLQETVNYFKDFTQDIY